MGFRYRKSINLGGGFRINLSKSGVGYSWGVPGYRITRTASGKTRKTYSIPGTGLSYSETMGSRNSGSNRGTNNPSRNNYTPQPQNSSAYVEAEHSIETADIQNFREANLDTISKTMEKTIRINKWGTGLLWCGLLACGNPVFIILPLVGIALKILAHKSGKVDLTYDLDPEKTEEHYRRISAWEILQEGNKEWQILTEQHNSNTKVNAGASRSIKRETCTITKKTPFYLKTNVDVIQIKLKKEILLVMPDRFFIVRGSKVGSENYDDIHIETSSTRFVESDPVPRDAQVVGHTWQYVNKNGTPDRRYSNNRQFPVCLYGVVTIRSSSGINVELHVSNIQKCRDFAELLNLA